MELYVDAFLYLLLTRDNLFGQAHRPLWFGSSQANRSVFITLSTVSVGTMLCSTLIISSVFLVVPPGIYFDIL